MDYRTFYTSSSTIFLWSYELDLLQDSSVAPQEVPARLWEKEDYPVHPRRGDGQKLEIWDSYKHNQPCNRDRILTVE